MPFPAPEKVWSNVTFINPECDCKLLFDQGYGKFHIFQDAKGNWMKMFMNGFRILTHFVDHRAKQNSNICSRACWHNNCSYIRRFCLFCPQSRNRNLLAITLLWPLYPGTNELKGSKISRVISGYQLKYGPLQLRPVFGVKPSPPKFNWCQFKYYYKSVWFPSTPILNTKKADSTFVKL